MRITTRLRIISTATAAALAVLAPVLIWSFIEFKNAKNDYVLANVILDNFFERASLRDQYFLYREDRVRTQWDKNKEISDRLLRQAKIQFQGEEDQKILERLRINIEDTATIFHRIANTKALDTAAANRLVYAELDKRLSSQLLLKAAAVRDTATTLKDASAQRIEQTYQRLAFIIGLFAVTLALAIILTTMQIGRLIRKRLTPLHEGAKIVADGNLDYRLKSGGSDEFAELAVSINAMTEKLVTEINGHRRAEDTLRKLSIAVEQSPASVVITDLEASIQYVNPRFTEVTGYTAIEAIGQNPRILQSGQTPKEVYLELWDKLTSGLAWHGELLNKSKNGELYWEDAHIAPVKTPAGIVTHYVAVKTDITERKRVEGALAESESRFREIFNTVSEAIFIHDAETGRILDVNQRTCEMYGITREEALACGPDDLSAATPPYSSAEATEKICMARTGGPQTFDWLARTRDGYLFWVEVSLRFALIGGQQQILAVVRDITERKAYEEELKRSNTELEQFSYAVSHDMRQPLRMISSYLQLLEMSLAGQLDGEKRDYLNFAVEGAKRIDQMLVALLEYSRVGRMGEPPTWIESRAALDEALQFLQPAIAEAQAKVSIAGEWPRILVSHDEILRLLQNLIGNAAKFRVAGRIPEISVTSKIDKNEWCLCVADNGVGIIPDQIKRLFQVFQRLQLRTAYEGNGVGLALCRKIAEHHKGRIWAESAGEGQGSRFCVALPVLRSGGG